jgi:hypothetical protein
MRQTYNESEDEESAMRECDCSFEFTRTELMSRAKERCCIRRNHHGWIGAETNEPQPANRSVWGTLEKHEVKTGSSNGVVWAMHTYFLSGDTSYSTFDAKIAEVMQGINVGEVVEFTLERKGDFENITEARKVEIDMKSLPF